MDQNMKQDQVPLLKPVASSRPNGDEQMNRVGLKRFPYACEFRKGELAVAHIIGLFIFSRPVLIAQRRNFERNTDNGHLQLFKIGEVLMPIVYANMPSLDGPIGRCSCMRSWMMLFIPKQEVRNELFILYEIVWPVVVTGLLLYSRNQVSMLFLGQLGTAQLAGGSIANAFANITGYSVLKGLSAGMEPICGQAYGARQWPVLNQTVQKTILLLLAATIPISLLWLYMEPALLLCYQKPEILAPAKEYILFSLPDLFAQAFLHPVRIFLRTQNITMPVSVCATASLLLHIPISYFLVFSMGLGVKGVALASSLNTININLGLIGYMIFSKSCLKPWTSSLVPGLKGWIQLIRLAVPSCIGVCLEWWWYEVMMVVCGWLVNPKASVASFGILIQMTSLIYVFPSSLGLGLSTRVSHELGAGRPTQAKLASAVGIVVSMVCGIVSCIFAISVKGVWGQMFNKDPSILHLTAVALPIIGICEMGNSLQTVGCGVLRGSAKPTIGAHINFAAFYLIGLPVSLLCAFPFKLGFVGLLMGLLAAQASCACFMLYAICTIDWDAQVEKARNFTESSGEKSDLEASLIVTEYTV